jgi:signal transduction histidine kinase
MRELKLKLESIDSELEMLADYSLRSGVGSIGFRTMWRETAEHTEWIEVELEQEVPLDQIVLTPTLWRDSKKGFVADAFPQAFRVIAQTDDQQQTVVAEFKSTDHLLPRIAPLVIPAGGITASRVRLEASRLPARFFDGKFILQLSEIMVFSGDTNVALRRPVNVSSAHPGRTSSAWNKRFLTDSHTPYLMNAAEGIASTAYIAPARKQANLVLDIGQPLPLSRIHLHAVEQGDTVPQAHAGNFGFPDHLRVEGASRPDFSDATTLLEFKQESLNDTGPIMMWHFPETICRYVQISNLTTNETFQLGFAEIELFSGETNVALGKPVQSETTRHKPSVRALSSLTDGRNLYGNILPIREWMEQLARRHDLERDRPAVVAELDVRYARQRTNLNRMAWLTALLFVGTAFAILIERFIHLGQLTQLKERFAADLHDELGANLHTIGLLSDLAEESREEPDELSEFLRRIRTVTERSGTAVCHVTNLHESNGLFVGLKADIMRAAERIVAQLEHTLVIEGEEYLSQLKPHARIDLFLFYKECLINICRHSGATRLSTRLSADPKNICLTITDNGRGIPDSIQQGIPRSLKRRAHLLGATVSMERPESGGTEISLRLQTRWWQRYSTVDRWLHRNTSPTSITKNG